MEKPIVSPEQMSVDKVLGKFAEWWRMMKEAGLPFKALQRPIDDPDFRNRLVEFWMSGGENVKNEKKSSQFKIWRTLKLGTGLKTADDFRKALKKSGSKIGNWADDLLGRSGFQPASTKEIEVDLYILTTAELTGKPKGGTTAEVFAGAQRLGFEKCPPEVGPQLRLQYQDQPMNEWLLIGMEPITDSNGNLDVFYVVRDGYGQGLYPNYDFADYFWFGSRRWVFVRRK